MASAKRKLNSDSPNVQAILAMIMQIPPGCVASYGQIAKLAGIPRNSRQVGAVLRALPRNSDVPWFRIVNSKGEIAARGRAESEAYQRLKLEAEGIEFDDKGRVPMNEYSWNAK